MSEKPIQDAVQSQYAAVARSGLNNDSPAVRAVAESFGYSPEDLASLPPQANMGLSCGIPTAMAGLKAGEVVVDLGCGGGLDVLLAAKTVGRSGKAIGIDMTPEMIERARAGATATGATNTEFHLAQIDDLPLPDDSVDCILSNCVINLVPDKPRVFREILRVLKPGGQIAISDIALRQPLPPEVASSIEAYVGCIAGAILISDYERLLQEAGFEAVVVSETGADLNVYAEASSGGCCSSSAEACCSPVKKAETSQPLHDGLAKILERFDANVYAVSVRVHALKSSNRPSFEQSEDHTMKTIEIYDKPLCCSTGVCGPQVDPVLPRFAADLEWLRSQGYQVSRYNLAQQPAAFTQNTEVTRLLHSEGVECLPLIVVDGQIVSRRGYPSREMLALWTRGEERQASTGFRGGEACCCGSGCC